MDETTTPAVLAPPPPLRGSSLAASSPRCVYISFGETFSPAAYLDMLVDLYISESEGRAVYLWSLCMAAGIPVSTAHRKIADLERESLVEREEPHGDRRRVVVRMTPKGRDVIDAMLDRFAVILE